MSMGILSELYYFLYSRAFKELSAGLQYREPMFRRHTLPASSGSKNKVKQDANTNLVARVLAYPSILKTEAIYPSETSADFQRALLPMRYN
jgi:hypothetical protein